MDENANTTVGPLVLDLELLHRRISCTNKTPLSTCAHSLNHSHTYILNPQHSEDLQTFLLKGKKLVCACVELQVVCIIL